MSFLSDVSAALGAYQYAKAQRAGATSPFSGGYQPLFADTNIINLPSDLNRVNAAIEAMYKIKPKDQSGNNGNDPNKPAANKPISLENPTEYIFKMIDKDGKVNAQFQRLVQIEQEIKAKQKDAAKEADPAKKNAINGEIEKLQTEYKKLERETGSTRATQKLGEAYNFYSNFDTTELKQVAEKTTEINGMKKDAQAQRQKIADKKIDLLKRIQSLKIPCLLDTNTPIQKNIMEQLEKYLKSRGMSLDLLSQAGISQEDVNEIVRLESELTALEKEIKEKIDKLKDNVKTSGQNNQTTYFNTNSAKLGAQRAAERKLSAENAAESKNNSSAKNITAAIYDKDKKPIADVDKRTEAMLAAARRPENKVDGVTDNNREAAIRFFSEHLSEKDGVLVTNDKFFADLLKKSSVDLDALQQITMIERLYNQLYPNPPFKVALANARYSASNRSVLKEAGKDTIANADARSLYSMEQTLWALKNNKDSNIKDSLVKQAKMALEAYTARINAKNPSVKPTNEEMLAMKRRLTEFKDSLNQSGLKGAYNSLISLIDSKTGSTSAANPPAGTGLNSPLGAPSASAKRAIENMKNFIGSEAGGSDFKLYSTNKKTQADFTSYAEKLAQAEVRKISDKFGLNNGKISDFGLILALSSDNQKVASLLAGYQNSNYACETDEIKAIVLRLNNIAQRIDVPERICIKNGEIKLCAPQDGWEAIDSTVDQNELYHMLGGTKADGTTPADASDIDELFTQMSKRLMQRF